MNRSFLVVCVSCVLFFSCNNKQGKEQKSDDVVGKHSFTNDSITAAEMTDEPNLHKKFEAKGGVVFEVVSDNDQLSIITQGLEKGKDTIKIDIDGAINDIVSTDLDNNGFSEIYCFCSSAGSGSYGQLYAYASNRNKSLSGIYLPEIENDVKLSDGYMGHDSFRIQKDRLIRSFPIYKETDPNAAPSGGIREISYKLKEGEAGWVLKQDTVIEIKQSVVQQ